MNSWILAIDTSTEACSCALGNAVSTATDDFRYTDVPRKHAEKVLPMVDELLAAAQINKSQVSAIAFGRGPGAFTGLRIAASVVQGLAFALDIPVIPISSLLALAQRGYREFNQKQTIAAIDARMGEIYWGCYQLTEQQFMRPVDEEKLTAPANLQFPSQVTVAWSGIGTGWQYQRQMPNPGRQIREPVDHAFTHGIDILTLARPRFRNQEVVAPELAVPVYLRNQVVQKP